MLNIRSVLSEPICVLLMVLPGLERPVQAGSGDLQCPANVHDGMSRIIQFLSNAALLYGDDFWSAAFFPLALAATKPAWSAP
jgi:hypothetical protein